MNYSYSINRFKSTRDKGYHEALSIYARSTPVDIRTNTNEISEVLDNPDPSESGRSMYFFALLFNNMIVGFAELAYILTIKAIIIDYISLEEQFKRNSVFYPFLNLLLEYIIEDKGDICFTITEISRRNNGDDSDIESVFFKKMLASEDFHIIDGLYYQPYLGINKESNYPCELLIRLPSPAKCINTQTYQEIVHAIYYSHYLLWYRRFLDVEELLGYKRHLDELSLKILHQNNLSEIDLISFRATDCIYYDSNRCKYMENSTAGAPKISNTSKRIWFSIPIFIFLVFGISIGFYYALAQISIASSAFIPIYAATATAVASMVAAVITMRNRKN